MNFILWNADPSIFTIPGFDREIRWYGLLFAVAFFIGSKIIERTFKIERKDLKLTDPLLMYIIVGTVVGARLGHVLFYGPYFDGLNQYGVMEKGYFSHPLSILAVWEGGLASHGAGIGMVTAIFLFYRRHKDYKFIWLLDRIAITIALGGCLIRFGNFMNSEIIGTPSENGIVFVRQTTDILNNNLKNLKSVDYHKTDADTTITGFTYPKISIDLVYDKAVNQGHLENVVCNAVIAKNEDSKSHSDVLVNQSTPTFSYSGSKKANFDLYVIPRHPSQLYESISSLLLFFILFGLYNKFKTETPNGLLSGIFFVYIFSLRFVYEFFKENQVAMEDGMLLNMGQKLSIPMVLFGFWLIHNAIKKKSISS